MFYVAARMLMGDRAKYFGILMGVTLASLVITQQGSIFVGLMSRTFGFITDVTDANIWVMDRKVQFIDDIKPLQDTELSRVRGVEGVQWAVPLYKGLLKARLDNGQFQTCNVIGLDDATLVGGPAIMVEGKVEDLRRADGVIVDDVGAATRLARPPTTPGGQPEPLKIGDILELNDNRAVVVGICKTTRTFQSQPVVYTTYSRAKKFAPRERKQLSFVLATADPGVPAKEVCERITMQTGLAAYTSNEFKWITVMYFIKYTGIPINFGIAVGLGFLIGSVITGFMFYNFTLDNLRFLGTLKAMGASDGKILSMIMFQAAIVALIGYGFGTGLATLFGASMKDTNLAFRLTWQLMLVSGAAVTVITMLAALLSVHKVLKLEPAIVFKG
ncbi:MAG: ABC transporter permease [Planctomycetota bacterium]|nr:ABC transporter permease [Planctomycetota bacterium]